MKIVGIALLWASIVWSGGFKYETKKPHLGGDVTPIEAYEMLQKENVYLIDCRTRPEYQLIGHPVNAYNIPLKFWSTDFGKKKEEWEYLEKENENFQKDLLARFNPKKDTLLFICRSGERSCSACDEAIKAGWSEDRVFNVLGGFEGDKVKNKNSIYYGHRRYGGWRNEGLPWTYKMDKNLIYLPDQK